MGGAVRAAQNAVSSAVSTVTTAAHDLVNQPLKGAAEVAVGLAGGVAIAEAASLKDATKGIPVVGTLTAGAGAAQNALNSVEAGKLPSTQDLQQIAAAGGAAYGVTGDTGLFDFSSFLDKLPGSSAPASPTKVAPGRSVNNFITTGGGVVPGDSLDFASIAMVAGFGLAAFLILKGK